MHEAFLEIARGGRRELIAVASQRYTLGRGAGNDLGLPEDSAVSGQHAVIERQAGGGWLIRDLDSANGTRVNGLRITGPTPLSSGDVVLIGQTPLSFRDGPPGRGPETGVSPGRETGPASMSAPSGYLDISEEWGHAAPPSAMAATAGPTQDGRPGPAPLSAGPADPGRVVPGRVVPARAVPGPAVPGPAVPGLTKRGPAHARGIARGVQVRGSNEGKTLVFRVERYDVAGNRLPPVGAQLKGYRAGHLSDGDEVEVSGRWVKGTLEASRVTNLSTGAQVLGMSIPSKVALRGCYALICLFIGGIAVFLLLAFLGV